MAINRQQLRTTARQLADELKLPPRAAIPISASSPAAWNWFTPTKKRCEILRTYEPPAISRISYRPHAASGCAATEAPRGLLYHRYEIDDDGKILLANIVPPTSQNQWQIEDDLLALLPSLLHQNDVEVAANCERAIRNYDPCISCSTHFLKLRIDGR